jgi:metal-responsive CopG/Arc/MetJ family transcriptional regulator
MGLPARHGLQFSLFLHILKKRDHAAQLLGDRSLYATLVIVLDKAPKPLMQNVPNIRAARIVSSYALRKRLRAVIALRGTGAKVQHFADHIIAERGVRYGRLVMIPTEGAKKKDATRKRTAHRH